ncbi:hypothetical protein SDC9_151206 [bioreactor metagenome]|uniref:Uncharacterized protein n=1 Tax=bioreactor metagenome TaxID=1076179 RepID=A0A645EPM7_9ZZZZ
MLATYVVAILSLKAKGRGHRHLCVEVGIFAIALPLPGPACIPSQVHRWREGPGYVACPCFISSDARSFFHQSCIKCSRHTDGLREENSSCRVCSTVDGIYAIDYRNTRLLQCPLLYGSDGIFPYFGSTRPVVTGVEDGAHLVFPNHGIEHGRIHLKRFVTEIGISSFSDQIDGELSHLPHFFFQRHL